MVGTIWIIVVGSVFCNMRVHVSVLHQQDDRAIALTYVMHNLQCDHYSHADADADADATARMAAA